MASFIWLVCYLYEDEAYPCVDLLRAALPLNSILAGEVLFCLAGGNQSKCFKKFMTLTFINFYFSTSMMLSKLSWSVCH
jgi:hypothetical protein